MAYQKPLVMVYQEYAQLSSSTETATLFPCVVGPCFHLIDEVDDELLAYAGELDESGFPETLFPNNYPGAVIQPSSVNIRLKDAIAQLNASPLECDDIVNNTLVFNGGAEASLPEVVAVGDIVKVVNGSDGETVIAEGLRVIRIVAGESGAGTIYLNKTITTAATLFDLTFTRNVGEILLNADSVGVTIDAEDSNFTLAPLNTSIGGSVYPLVGAKVYVGYAALRQDLSEVNTIETADELVGVLGKVDSANPLAYAVNTVLANTTTPVKFVGVDTEDVAGYTAAKERLELVDNVYGIVPLSQEIEIITIFKTHAQQMSVPEVGKWRCCIASTALATTKDLADGDGAVSVNDDTIPVVFTDAAASFLSSSVDAGDILALTDGEGAEHEYTIAEVVSEDMLTVVVSDPIDTEVFTLGVSYDYRVYKTLDKASQADEVAAVGESLNYQRCVHVWPDRCTINGVEEPGYYLACAVAGMTAGLPSHQGFTRLNIAGIGGIRHSNDYFSQAQLDAIANGGTFIFVQDSPSAAPYCRHQLTTDMSAIELKEFSFVKNFDYVCYICKDVLDRFLGQYNITPATLATLETAVRATLESLRLNNLPKIGAPVLGYDVTSVRQLDDIRDRVEIYAEVSFPYVLNTIGLHLISQ